MNLTSQKSNAGGKEYHFVLSEQEYNDMVAGKPCVKVTGSATWEKATFTMTFKGKKRAGEANGHVTAECHSDDRIVEASFNAALWLEKATPKEIVALSRCGWGGDYPADAVCLFMSDFDENVADMHLHIETLAKARAAGVGGGLGNDAVGFECHIDAPEARAWLAENRPDVYKKVCEAEDDA